MENNKIDLLWGILSLVSIVPLLGIISIGYAIILFFRKKPSFDKAYFLNAKDNKKFVRNEVLIYLLWGFSILTLSLVSANMKSLAAIKILILVGVCINTIILVYKYKNNTRFITNTKKCNNS